MIDREEGVVEVSFACCGLDAEVLGVHLRRDVSAVRESERWDARYLRTCTSCGARQPFVAVLD